MIYKIKIVGMLTLAFLLLNTCINSNKDEYKQFHFDEEYKVGYVKYPKEKITSVNLITSENIGIGGHIIEIVYNKKYLYIKYNATREKPYYRIKYGNFNTTQEEITQEDYLQYKKECTDCKIIDMDMLNEKDKDIPIKNNE